MVVLFVIDLLLDIDPVLQCLRLVRHVVVSVCHNFFEVTLLLYALDRI